MRKPHIEFYDDLSYKDAESLQRSFHSKVINKEISWALMGLEHKPVITLGKRANPTDDLQVDAETIKDLGYEIVESERGGQATLHNKGQLVIYPIISLREHGMGVKAYVDLLLEITRDILAIHNISSVVSEERPGLYTPNGKIAFVGIRVENGVSRHGISINVNNELADFALISSCGEKDAKFDQVQRHSPVPLRELFKNGSSYLRLKSV
jgi:lipoyl(octanoyl) transferase